MGKNFTMEEFEKSETAERLGIDNQILESEIGLNIHSLCDDVLQPLRDAWGKPLKINSGYRCSELNKAVGGVPTSQHTKGEAADVACDTPIELARLVIKLKLPYDQLIVYPTFCHISHKRSGKNRNQLLYNKRYKGEKI